MPDGMYMVAHGWELQNAESNLLSKSKAQMARVEVCIDIAILHEKQALG